MNPRPGEVWFFDLGYRAKPRWAMVLTNPPDKRLALATVVLITTQFDQTPYELALPRVPWLPEQSYINAQSLQPAQLHELKHKARGQFDTKVFEQVRSLVRTWLAL